MVNVTNINRRTRVFLFVFCLFSVFLLMSKSVSADFFSEMLYIIKHPDWFFIKTIYLIFINFVLAGLAIFVDIAAALVDVFLNSALYDAVLGTGTTGNPTAIQVGWETVRDFCNMFYVFFLLLVAFATITRNHSYSAKNILPKLIVSMFLINFSMVIAKVVIDFGQVFLFGISGWMSGGFSGSGSGLTSIVDYFQAQFVSNINPSVSALLLATFALVYVLVLGLLYLILAGFLLIRLIYFVFLIIVSPFAFFSIVMPSMRVYSSKWWSALVTNSISGAIFIFFVYLSTEMANELSYMSSVVTTPSLGIWGNVLNTIIPHLIALAMLWMAIPATQAIGTAGSRQIIGGTAGVGKAAALVGFGAAAGYKVARSGYNSAYNRSEKFANKVDSIKGNIRSSVGAVPVIGVGHQMQSAASEQVKKQKELDNRIEKYGGNLMNMDVDVLFKGDNIDKMVGVKAAAEQNKLGDENIKDKFASLSGYFSQKDINNLVEKNPLLATMTKEGKARIGNLKGAARDDEIEKILSEKFAYLVSEGKMSKVQNLNDPTVNRAWMNAQSFSQMNGNIKSMNKKQKALFAEGATKNAKNSLGGDKVNYASAAVRAGAPIDNVLEREDHMNKGTMVEFNKNLKQLIKKMDASGFSSWSDKDLKDYGYLISKDQATQLVNAREDRPVNVIISSLESKKTKSDVEEELLKHMRNKLT